MTFMCVSVCGTRAFGFCSMWDGAGAVRQQWCWNQPQWTRKWFCFRHVSGTGVNTKTGSFNAFICVRRHKEHSSVRDSLGLYQSAFRCIRTISVWVWFGGWGKVYTQIKGFSHALYCKIPYSKIYILKLDHHNTPFLKCYYIFRLQCNVAIPHEKNKRSLQIYLKCTRCVLVPELVINAIFPSEG